MSSIENQVPFNLQYNFIALMDKVGVELCRFLKSTLLSQAGANWWTRNVVGVLNPEEQQKIDSSGFKQLEDLDVHVLLKVLERNYRFLRKGLRLPMDGGDIIYEVRQVRNRCIGHRPVRGHDPEQLGHDIQTLERFCTTILGASVLAKEFKALVQSGPQPELTAKPLAAVASPTPCTQAPVHPQARTGIPEPAAVSLAAMFTGVDLTGSQQQAVARIESFLRDEQQDCFVLKGYAGTGKTFLIGGIVKYLKACNKTTILMAPTGRAAYVMKEHHGIPASTIHRRIYALGDLKEFKEVDEEGDITFKFYFGLRNNFTEHDTVFIVDEASMLSDVYSEAEFMRFGSGRLLRDLLEYVNFDANDYRKKIIFVGDDAQLPPVGMNSSPALDEGYLERYIRSKVNSIELTDVVRQNEASVILRNATTLRGMLKTNNFTTFDLQCDGKIVEEVEPGQFISHYLQHVDGDLSRLVTSVIVGYSNALVKDYNTRIREHLFPGGRLLEPSDRVMLVKNNYNYKAVLFNGQVGSVVSVADRGEIRSVFVNVGLDEEGKRKNMEVVLNFRDVKIRFENLEGTKYEIECKYIENLLSSADRELRSEQSKALYVDFKSRYPNLNPHKPEFKEMLVNDPYFNALQLKYAYAVTCHKAQGGEWPTVYVDFQGQNKLDPMTIRWSYTALTRAMAKVIATNALHHNLLTPLRQRVAVTVPAIAPQSPPNSVAQVLPSTPLPDFVATASIIDQQIYMQLKALLPEGYSIDSLTVGSYLSQWAISKDSNSCLVKVHYNGKNKITSVLLDKVSAGDWSNSLQSAIQELKNIHLGTTSAIETQAALVLDNKAPHGSFFINLNARCISLNIRVCSIEHLTDFHSRCTFETGGHIFYVNYHFNARQQFTSYITESGLPDRILQVIANIHSEQQPGVIG